MSSAQITGASLAEALASRLGAAVPSNISIQARGAGVSVLKAGRLWMTNEMPEILDDRQDDRSVEEKLELACERVLDHVQDFVSEDLASPWPDSGAMQLPGAKVEEGRIRLWYGDRDRPFLALPDIPIAELG